MNKLFAIAVMSTLALTSVGPALAQTTSTGVTTPGETASKLVGASVYTVQGGSVGSIVRVVPLNHAGEFSAVLSLNQNAAYGTQPIGAPLSDAKIGRTSASAGTVKLAASNASGNDANWLAGGGG